jgi:hypothetical protein
VNIRIFFREKISILIPLFRYIHQRMSYLLGSAFSSRFVSFM